MLQKICTQSPDMIEAAFSRHSYRARSCSSC